ncbi:response regulator [Sphingomonas sp. ac-8]|uniref:response regulator n=1 Tax=Sphingomonas sp. ac-8 TaxID=3242977 RepID=UPI003A806C8A
MCHVLIIEDEPLIATYLQTLLEDEGATSFDFASSEEEAVAAARAHLPAVITSDVMLTQGTGPHAVSRIFDELGEIGVIFVTGSPDQCEPCAPPGVVLSKPVQPADLAQAFRSFRAA